MEKFYTKKKMRVLIFLLVLATKTIAQNAVHPFSYKMSKKEFLALKENMSKYIPNDIHKYTLIIKSYSVDEMITIKNNSILESYLRNGFSGVDIFKDSIEYDPFKGELDFFRTMNHRKP